MATIFISGHLDLTDKEFHEHYVPEIVRMHTEGHRFVVGDARGADTKAQDLLKSLDAKHVFVYHMFTAPRYNAGFLTVGGFVNDKQRDEKMTFDSQYDLAWVRPGREKSGTAANLKRREALSNHNKE